MQRGTFIHRLLYAVVLCTSLLGPSVTSAQSVAIGQIFGYLNILAGLMIVAAFLCFGGGLIVYVGRWGLPGRDTGITIMSWGVTILFVLVIMLALASYVQEHLELSITIIALIIFVYAGKWIMSAVQAANAGGEEHK